MPRMNYPKRLLLAAACLATASLPALGTETTAPTFPKQVIGNSEIRTLPPSANGRNYQLYVALPYGYAAHPEKHYPVLYLCDGYWDFTLICGLYGNLLYDKAIPEFIVVGFGYAGENPDYDKLRRLDYTPVASPDDKAAENSGHAAEFLSVIEKEIIPFVEKEYRVDPSYRVLGGSSLGGLFTLYALFEKPELFQTCIAPSPSCEWADGWFLDHEAAFAKTHDALPARLFLTTTTDEWPNLHQAVLRLDARLKAKNYAGLTYKFRLIDDGERHGGTKPESYNRGIRFAFAPLVPKE